MGASARPRDGTRCGSIAGGSQPRRTVVLAVAHVVEPPLVPTEEVRGTVDEDDRVPPHLAHRDSLEYGDVVPEQPGADGAATGRAERRSQGAAAHQRDRASLLGRFGGPLDVGQPAADHGDRSVAGQLLQPGTQPLRVLEFGKGYGASASSPVR